MAAKQVVGAERGVKLLQNRNAFRLLAKCRQQLCLFGDDTLAEVRARMFQPVYPHYA